MPSILDSWVKKVMKKWYSKQQAYAIIYSTLTKSNILDKNWKLTELGKKRNRMTPLQRERIPLSDTKKLLQKKK